MYDDVLFLCSLSLKERGKIKRKDSTQAVDCDPLLLLVYNLLKINFAEKKYIMDTIVLANHDCLKGNLKKMLLNQYQNRHLIKVFLWIGQLIRIANSNLNDHLFMHSYEILRDLTFAIKIRCVICKYSIVENSWKF